MTPVRKFENKKRNSESRKQKPIILIVTEGDNVTESQYFKSFQRQNSKCNIRIIIAKHVTDPDGMVKAIKQKWKELELDARKGDKAYVVLDLDCDDDKANIIRKLGNKTKEVQFVVSNPCFEVWFLLHFRYSTKPYYSSDAVIKDLKTYIPEYEKNMDLSYKIADNTIKALENAEKLRKYFEELGCEWPSNARNPQTDADDVIRTIIE